MHSGEIGIPWVSFCMSTYKRPGLLKTQLYSILQQTFLNFEVVISDNDPDCSARDTVSSFQDIRLQYFSNVENLGMIKSFNKSIERARGKYVVMITDDDPVLPEMLKSFHKVINENPGFGIYCGCERVGAVRGKIEKFDHHDFVFELLHPLRTKNLLWSSCLLDAQILKDTGGMPNYGSPHLADHVMLALCGGVNGGVMINQMYSQLTEHDNNFSKTNIDLYYIACQEFYRLITSSFDEKAYIQSGENALLKHLERWFITYSFALRKYYTHSSLDEKKIKSINADAKKVLALPFMQQVRNRYYLKLAIFNLKSVLIQLRLFK